MSDLTPHEDREAMIIDSYEGSLGPDEVADATLLAEILADPSSWAEPRDDLENDIVRAVEHDVPVRTKSAWTSRRMFLLSAAAALVVIALGAL